MWLSNLINSIIVQRKEKGRVQSIVLVVIKKGIQETYVGLSMVNLHAIMSIRPHLDIYCAM